MGTIRKQEDPITKTQTDPILYKQKLEETKDGEKGPPTPSWKLYPKEGFMADSPVENKKEEVQPEPQSRIPNVGQPIPEDLRGLEPDDTNAAPEPSKAAVEEKNPEDRWWEEGNDEKVIDLQEEAQNAEKSGDTFPRKDWQGFCIQGILNRI